MKIKVSQITNEKGNIAPMNSDSETSMYKLITKGTKRRNNDETSATANNKIYKMDFTTPNRYASLSQEDEIIVSNENQNSKKRPPPPIIIKGKPAQGKHKEFISIISNKIKKGFHIINRENNTNLFIHSEDEWISYKNYLKEEKVEFFSYTMKKEKNHAFVLKGIEHEDDPETIKGWLLDQNLPVQHVYKMRTRGQPLFMIITNNEITLKIISNIKTLDHVVIKWENVINKKQHIQCRRCQMWSHALSNCNNDPRCLKCAADHMTNMCPHENETPPKCANCDGNHLANNTDCPTYQEMIKKKTLQHQTQTKSRSRKISTLQAKGPKVNKEHFPPLRRQATTVTSPWANNPTENQVKNTPSPQSATHTNESESLTGFNELVDEIKTLNSLCNITEMTRAIKDLNELMKKCQSKNEKFTTMITFTHQNINTYGI